MSEDSLQQILLASASPRRVRLLARLGLPFKSKASNIDESIRAGEAPVSCVTRLALEKARHFRSSPYGDWIIGADTAVVLDHHILGKPSERKEAEEMLRLLSGREHQVLTGVAVIRRNPYRESTGYERTRVRFRNLSDDDIRWYLDTGEYEGKAGAYAIQGQGVFLVNSVEGCFFNVVGLPLVRLRRLARETGLDLLSLAQKQAPDLNRRHILD